MQLSLIEQILAQNEYVQQLPIVDGPSSLLSAYKYIEKLAKTLSRYTPAKKGGLTFTILANYPETDYEQIWSYYHQSGRDSQARTKYKIAFERLQYQTNLAVSMLV